MSHTNPLPPVAGTERVVPALRRKRLGVLDAVLLVAAVATYFFADLYLALATSVLIMIIFALSLDLVQGYCGIETLGHAAFFGSGAYAAGLFALHVSPDPLLGLVAGAVVAALVGLMTGVVVLRVSGLTQIMLTLACATLLYEAGNVAKSITMGDDGLTGYTVAPVLGLFEFDIYGHTAYLYALAVLLVVYLFTQFLVNSPFGLTVQGIRENAMRMSLLGVRVGLRRLMLYTLAAAVAGVAGALSAQVNNIVALDTLSFTLSANVLVMLALGGTGRLYGAVLGAVVFMVLSDRIAAIDPTNWLAALGVLLIVVVRFAPDGLIGLVDRFAARFRRPRHAVTASPESVSTQATTTDKEVTP
ncbi:branched-chain amino acid ABC transporter permease [Pandoraea apista]|uniref:Branched-chain amino acid ABC transporter permease n=1 Tax=Pandoraea apista TaxID=93218 RepID=A0ABX9ZUI7_9BURK|nr:branched-chain amino acid ABC transporter permease [Pandoraea apista]ALS66058.1 branched-chain amino acid ABC transporter permease [Pandoraea apista]AVF39072.1 branched-chain amino acid ABC transporter permease [Pandoraea apista]PTE02404.1 branched-chain amino acid ABC transporter permease [Pandoraea apista]RRJ33333.1 branched-chain amino acid ABC transporter permease [Pandoraea apista]RRJ82097.1 branched-chain amino acid ABC transporter permease [Pandoraea apista]